MSSAVVQERKQRWLTFYDRSRPGSHVFVIRYAPELGERPWPNPWLKAERIEWSWRSYEWHAQRMSWLDDDTIPCLDMLTGTELFAEAFGCPVHRPDDNMPFALPLVHSAAEADRLTTPSLDAPPLALAFEMADELGRRAGKAAIFRLVDLQSPMDVAALIWEKQSFYLALIDAPEAVLRLVGKIKALQFAFLDEWFRRYGRELIAHYPDYYLPYGVTLSVDEVGTVSQAMFNTFFMPELADHANRYGAIGIHCCATARHQWGNFKKVPKLQLMNINQPEVTAREATSFFADRVAQWCVGWGPSPGNPEAWASQLPEQARMVFDVTVESRAEALEASEKLVKICRVPN